jgi:hypothetical protein
VLAAGIATSVTPAAQAADVQHAGCSTAVHTANGADGMVIIGDAVGVGNGQGATFVRSGCARTAVTRIVPLRINCRNQPPQRVALCLEVAQRIRAEFIRRAVERAVRD